MRVGSVGIIVGHIGPIAHEDGRKVSGRTQMQSNYFSKVRLNRRWQLVGQAILAVAPFSAMSSLAWRFRILFVIIRSVAHNQSN
jgi:hypothetical protein